MKCRLSLVSVYKDDRYEVLKFNSQLYENLEIVSCSSTLPQIFASRGGLVSRGDSQVPL